MVTEMHDPGEPEDAGLASLEDLKLHVDGCRRCPLYASATQGVAGEGPLQADIMFVGEQPGDQEDLVGKPFVGPAGKLFSTALERIGIDRSKTYVTNAVKHFKFEPRGKRRIHMKPNTSEVMACRWWIAQEVQLLRPKLIVALGATAALSITGKALPVQKSRGTIIPAREWTSEGKGMRISRGAELAAELLITVHPSFLLRLQTEGDKRREWRAFLDDLWLAGQHAEALVSGQV